MMYGYRYGTTMMGRSWVGDVIMLILGLLVLVGIALLIIWAIRALTGGHTPMAGQPGAQHPGMQPPAPPVAPAGHEEAVAIAKRRLASGEITPDQYAEIMKTLGS